MSDTPEPQPVDPALVKYLRGLVTVLTLTMIGGFLVIVFLFVTRFSGPAQTVLPEEITLPEGVSAQAFTRAASWIAIVTTDDQILVYDLSGRLLEQLRVTLPD